VQLGTYRVRGHDLRASDGELSVPSSVATLVSGVIGVDQSESRFQPNHVAAEPANSPSAGFVEAPPCSDYWAQNVDTTDPAYGGEFCSPLPYAPCGYKPGQLRSGYGLVATVDGGHTGASATVAVIDAFASSTIFQDASTYAQRNDPSHPLLSSQFSQYIVKAESEVAERASVRRIGLVRRRDARCRGHAIASCRALP
jgi:subtilase family serine protease